MKRKLWLSICLILGTILHGYAAQYVFDYNDRCHRAYQYLMALKLDEGKAEIIKEIRDNPYNLAATYIADYDDFLTLLINGDPKEYEQRHAHLDERLKLLSKGNASSPWYRFSKAGIHLHWAIVYLRLGENIKSALNFRRSFLLLKENKDRFPDFEYNKIFLGVEEAVVGAIPDDYRWLAAVFGMKGNVKKGMAQLESFVNESAPSAPLRNEAEIYYCYFKFYLLYQHNEVLAYMNSNKFSTTDNLLNTFVKANLQLNARKADAALQLLQIAQNNSNYDRFPVFDYEMGNGLLLNTNKAALNYYQRYINRYHGDLFIKDAWQKMALIYYMEGDMLNAERCKRTILLQGNTQVDADKQAQRFAIGKKWPDRTLLKTRLLTDGGYYSQAFTVITTKKRTDFTSIPDETEYCFRLARVYDELQDHTRALELYQDAITKGRNRQEYFAARAALQMAFIYEHAGQLPLAIIKYNECLHMKRHDFQASIDQQAKAGLSRLNSR
ncbi:MAG: hypothetical protein WCG87_09645 [Bacteroidota bacterium]